MILSQNSEKFARVFLPGCHLCPHTDGKDIASWPSPRRLFPKVHQKHFFIIIHPFHFTLTQGYFFKTNNTGSQYFLSNLVWSLYYWLESPGSTDMKKYSQELKGKIVLQIAPLYFTCQCWVLLLWSSHLLLFSPQTSSPQQLSKITLILTEIWLWHHSL